jgi:hypothetical protein
MFDMIINLLLSAVYAAIGSIFSVNTLQSVFYFVSSVISSENAVVAAVPTALVGAGAVVSLVTGKTRRFNPRLVNNNGGGLFSYQGLFWAFSGIVFCLFIRWPVTSIITIVLSAVQAYWGWITLEPCWQLLVQATMTWILSAIVAHHLTKVFKSCYQKVIHTICTAGTTCVVGVFRTVSSSGTWLLRVVLGLFFSFRYGSDSPTEDAKVEHKVKHEVVAATSVFTFDHHQGNYDMEDYVYDSDYDHEDEAESDIEYDSDDYDSDDDSSTALSTDDTEESCLLEDRHRCSPRLRGKPSPCYTKGKIDYSMRCN